LGWIAWPSGNSGIRFHHIADQILPILSGILLEMDNLSDRISIMGIGDGIKPLENAMLLRSMHFSGSGEDGIGRIARVYCERGEFRMELEIGSGSKLQRSCPTAASAAIWLLGMIDDNPHPTAGDRLGYERLLESLYGA
jgi:hypothetical protein